MIGILEWWGEHHSREARGKADALPRCRWKAMHTAGRMFAGRRHGSSVDALESRVL